MGRGIDHTGPDPDPTPVPLVTGEPVERVLSGTPGRVWSPGETRPTLWNGESKEGVYWREG